MEELNIGQSILNRIIQFLPTDPFLQYVEQFAALPYLPYLNWFFPVGQCVAILVVWLSAVSIYYIYSVAMRWAKLIGG